MPVSDAADGRQLSLFAPPAKLFACTPSRLATYEECPRRYRYTYIDRPTPPKGARWAHNSLGTSVHNALKRWYDLPETARSVGVLPRLLAGAWITDGYRDAEQSERVRQRALTWLERYAPNLPAGNPLGVERTVATKTVTLALSGRVDRIDARGGELVIVDYKTGRAAPHPDDARTSRALALYAHAAQAMFRKPARRVELHHLPTATVVTHEHTDESIARHLARAEATAADIQAEQEYPTRPGRLCSWCDFRAVCPAGADAPVKDPWSAIETDG